MHLAEQLNNRIVEQFKSTTKKFDKIITSTTRKILKGLLKSFDAGYRLIRFIVSGPYFSEKTVEVFQSVTKKLDQIFIGVTKKILKTVLKSFDFIYKVTGWTGSKSYNATKFVVGKPSRSQLAYLGGIAAILGVVYINTGVSEELKVQLEDTTQLLQQKEEAIDNLESKDDAVQTELKQKVEKLEEAETDIEKLEREKQEKEAEILQLQQELQAKLQRQEEARLASVQQAQAVAVQQTAYIQPQVVASTGSYNDGNNYPHGECTWGVDVLAGVPNALGNAAQWSYSLPQHGYVQTGATPGAIAVFQPGVQGASGWGHVAVVTAVNGDGTITVGESNFAGVRAITYRTTSPAGVQFFVR